MFNLAMSIHIPHPWLSENNGLAAHMRIMRGDDKLPHLPHQCEVCKDIFMAQLRVLRDNGYGLGLGKGKRNPGRMKLTRRIERVRERLQKLAAKQIQEIAV